MLENQVLAFYPCGPTRTLTPVQVVVCLPIYVIIGQQETERRLPTMSRYNSVKILPGINLQ